MGIDAREEVDVLNQGSDADLSLLMDLDGAGRPFAFNKPGPGTHVGIASHEGLAQHARVGATEQIALDIGISFLVMSTW